MPTFSRLATAMLATLLVASCASDTGDPADGTDKQVDDTEASGALDADQGDGADTQAEDADEPEEMEIDSPEEVELDAGTHVLRKGGHEHPVTVTLAEPTTVSALASDKSPVAGAIVFERDDMMAAFIEPTHMATFRDGEFSYVEVPNELPAWLESNEGANRHLHYQQIDGITVDGYDDQFVAVVNASPEWGESFESDRFVQKVDDRSTDGGFVSGYDPDGSSYVVLYLLDGDRWIFMGGKSDSAPLIAELLDIDADLQDKADALRHDLS